MKRSCAFLSSAGAGLSDRVSWGAWLGKATTLLWFTGAQQHVFFLQTSPKSNQVAMNWETAGDLAS